MDSVGIIEVFEAMAGALAHLSWREVLIAIIVLLVLYMLVAFLRMRRLKRQRAVVATAEPHVAQAAVAAYSEVQTPATDSDTLGKVAEVDELVSPALPEFPWNEPPPEIPGQQLIDALRRDVYQLRNEVGELRMELQLARDEMQLQVSQTQATQATQIISPLYSDAMQMAMQGHDAATISEHCGIARAEAELVVSLVRNRADAR
jgi:hypothetical protein